MDLTNPDAQNEIEDSPGEISPTEAVSTSPAEPSDEAEHAVPQTEEGEADVTASIEASPEEDGIEASASQDGDVPADAEDDAPSASDDEDEDSEDPEDDEPDTGVKRGDLYDGTIKETSPTQIVVELPEGIEGIITSRELEQLDKAILEALVPGAPLLVYVLRAPKDGGYAILSINRAKEEQDWREAEGYGESGQAYEGRIAGYNKGGLIVRFGRLRGFVPASQISATREARASGDNPDERWSSMLNETIMVKVVEVNRSRNRLILSERAATRESREKLKERLIETLKVGELRQGRVISLTDFGAFVDLGGADGLIHLTELSWKHVNHPRELLSVGDEIEVKVISVDSERKRIGLSRKILENDPWDFVERTYKEDQLVQGRITKLTRFGAFASLVDADDIEGLIHVSELADYRVEHPRDVVAVGDVLTLRVVKIDAERRRLGLSLKRVDSARYIDTDWNPD